jgi:hypothetical protein
VAFLSAKNKAEAPAHAEGDVVPGVVPEGIPAD